MTRAVLILALLSALGASHGARAEAGEWAISFGPSWRAVSDNEVGTHHAMLLALGFHYGLTDYWQLGGTLEGGMRLLSNEAQDLEDPIGSMTGARLDVRWLFDVLTWVPFVELSVGAVVRGRNSPLTPGQSPPTQRFDFIALASVGLDYRPSRDWSVGFRAGGGSLLTDLSRTGLLTRVELVATIYFD